MKNNNKVGQSVKATRSAPKNGTLNREYHYKNFN